MMADYAHEWTDRQIAELTRTMDGEYRKAFREMKRKVEQSAKEYARELAVWEKRVKEEPELKRAFNAWKRRESLRMGAQQDLLDSLAELLTHANEDAIRHVNGLLPKVYAENANYATYNIERMGRIDTSFTLLNQDAVNRIMADFPDLLPAIPSPKVDVLADLAWNKRKFNSAITQGILQGESVPDIAKRICSVVNMGESAAIRAARTATTSAENGGRMAAFERAEGMGIKMQREWMATLDGHTRQAHRELDGQRVPMGEPFKVDGYHIDYPGDPSAPGYLVYNCRCSVDGVIDEVKDDTLPRASKLGGVSYEEWKAGHPVAEGRWGTMVWNPGEL